MKAAYYVYPLISFYKTVKPVNFSPLFLQNTTVENAQSSTPLVINDTVAGEMAVFAVAVSENGLSPILRPVSLSAEADFIPR